MSRAKGVITRAFRRTARGGLPALRSDHGFAGRLRRLATAGFHGPTILDTVGLLRADRAAQVEFEVERVESAMLRTLGKAAIRVLPVLRSLRTLPVVVAPSAIGGIGIRGIGVEPAVALRAVRPDVGHGAAPRSRWTRHRGLGRECRTPCHGAKATSQRLP